RISVEAITNVVRHANASVCRVRLRGGDGLVVERAAVAAADRQVSIRERQVTIARGNFLPSVGLRVNYGGQRFPNTVWGLGATPLRRDVSATIGIQLPLFTGFRRSAELNQAQVELERSRLQLGQLREGVQVEYQRARGERARALASIAARSRNVEQAQRVHDLTVLRYEQGLATQLEVSDGRLALLQARTNLAQATADFLLADASVDRALGRVPAFAAGRQR
ncbi:MAG: TolC family protein, partial [Gemmatimonadota bacterium]